ncbi:MAG TPA: class I SAM-dependent methyltransferase [Bryobacterales bacterium]|nr:class I SAM-dependent methyltransferase [Bryobacterales bacterium]
MAEGAVCAGCGFRLEKGDGILRAIAPERRKIYERFREEYSKIRRAEGRGSPDPAYYRALPYKDLSGRHSDQWAIRARTYQYLVAHLLPGEASDILDLGAGNGWLSYRLRERGHRPVAVDLLTDALGGLGAVARYGGDFSLVEAEFDRLPFVGREFDLAIFNSSLHYSTDYRRTLAEALRCLRAPGRLVILDSPVYKRREHGEMMKQERRRQFEAQYGFRSDSISSIEYLDEALLGEIERDLGIRWEIHKPWYGWRWHLRPWKARLAGRRPPSRFWILAGSLGAA